MDIRIREETLPGIGHRYELALDEDRRLFVVVQRSGPREVGIFRGDADEPESVVSLTSDQAIALAAVLTGARMSFDTSEDKLTSADVVTVATVTLGNASPALGRLIGEFPLPADSDAAVLAVIRDSTAEVIEEPTAPTKPGDRVVVAARRDRLPAVLRSLVG